jgi:hypothetical protein
MKVKQVLLLMLLAFVFAWAPVNAQAAISSLNFSGTVDWLLSAPNYVNTFDGHTFVAGKDMTGYVEYDSAAGVTTKLWMDVRDQSNNVYHFESFGDGVYNFNSYIPNAHVFEITGLNGTLNNLVLHIIIPDGTGTWYFDYDNAVDPFRIGGTVNQVTPTPIPAAAWLLGSGLLGVMGIRRRTGK